MINMSLDSRHSARKSEPYQSKSERNIQQPLSHNAAHAVWLFPKSQPMIKLNQVIISLKVDMLAAKLGKQPSDHFSGDAAPTEGGLGPQIHEIRIADPIRKYPGGPHDFAFMPGDANAMAILK